MCETKERAQSVANDPRIEDKYISKYWVEPIKDTALIGDYLEHVKV
jgi:hypothetical protein